MWVSSKVGCEAVCEAVVCGPADMEGGVEMVSQCFCLTAPGRWVISWMPRLPNLSTPVVDETRKRFAQLGRTWARLVYLVKEAPIPAVLAEGEKASSQEKTRHRVSSWRVHTKGATCLFGQLVQTLSWI